MGKMQYLAAMLTAVIVAITATVVSYSFYPTNTITLYAYLVSVIGITATGFAMHMFKRFSARMKNPLVILVYGSVPLLMFLIVRSIVDIIAAAVYLIFIIVTLVLMDIEDMDVLENEPTNIKRFGIGMVIGAIMAPAIYYVYASLTPTALVGRTLLLGYLSQVTELVYILPVIFIMLFVVALPEELFFRILLTKVGAATGISYLSIILTGVMWYGMHAITRFEYPLALLMLAIVGVVLSALYICFGFYASLAAHAIYNVGIYALYEYAWLGNVVIVGFVLVALAIFFIEKKPIELNL